MLDWELSGLHKSSPLDQAFWRIRKQTCCATSSNLYARMHIWKVDQDCHWNLCRVLWRVYRVLQLNQALVKVHQLSWHTNLNFNLRLLKCASVEVSAPLLWLLGTSVVECGLCDKTKLTKWKKSRSRAVLLFPWLPVWLIDWLVDWKATCEAPTASLSACSLRLPALHHWGPVLKWL